MEEISVVVGPAGVLLVEAPWPCAYCFWEIPLLLVTRATLAYRESCFLLVFDEPEGVAGCVELPLACDAGGCQ
jgi:hypothetical protein